MADWKLLRYLRSRKVANMERDLIAQAEGILRDLFADRITDHEKLALETWLSSQLEQERLGWKTKIQMSMKEIEKERKMALDVHAAIHRLNGKLEEIIPGLEREPSMYHAEDAKDMKVSHIDLLERNVDAMLKMAKTLKSERSAFFECLDINEEENLAVVAIREKVDAFQRQVVLVEHEAMETETRLLREIQNLGSTLELQETASKQEVDKYRKQVEDMKSREKAVPVHVSSPVLATGPVPASVPVSVPAPFPRPVPVRLKSPRSTARGEIAIQVEVKKRTRDCCIQADVAAEFNRLNISYQSTGTQTVKQVLDEVSTPLKALIVGNSRGSVVRGDLNGSKNSSVEMSDEDSLLHALHKAMEGEIENIYRRGSTNYSDQCKDIEHLRSQVVKFAQSMDKNRHDSELCQRQMVLLQKSPRSQTMISSPTPRSTVLPSDGSVLQGSVGKPDGVSPRKWASSEGYLGGARQVNIRPPERGSEDTFSHTKVLRRLKDRSQTYQASSTSSLTAKCLRCHQVYKSKDNHRKACRYHPKGKRKLEKYDSGGKLLRIVQNWECCLQTEDSGGCTIGEHV